MIIGNNSNSNKGSSFVNGLKTNKATGVGKKTFGFDENLSDYVHTNTSDDVAMYDKSLAMLKDRLSKNLISIDEFNKKCEEIGKKKAAALNNKNKF